MTAAVGDPGIPSVIIGSMAATPRHARRSRSHHALDLAFAEALRMLGGALGERVGHERRRSGAACLKPIQKPMMQLPQERAPVPAHSSSRSRRRPQVHLGPCSVELEPFLHAHQDLADPEEPDHRHDEVEPDISG